MITAADIAEWRHHVPWVDPDQVEQDLVLSRLMIEIANHPRLRDELVMRGGTCLHKLWFPQPWRYSEDLDYVRRSSGPIGPVLDTLRELARLNGFDDVVMQVGQHPKARFRSTFHSGRPMRIKIEMNTFERSPAQAITTRPLSIASSWFEGHSDVPTFELEELVATKIRALYQRRKGRDLFDLWLAVEHAGADPSAIATCFGPYRPAGWTAGLALANLDAKLSDRTFVTDLDLLVVAPPSGYAIEAAASLARRVITLADAAR